MILQSGKLGIITRQLTGIVGGCVLALVLANVAAHADGSLVVAQSSRPSVEVALCDTGMTREPLKAGERRCPDGNKVKRAMLIPRNVDKTGHTKGTDGKNYEMWGIFMSILITDEGLMFQPQPPGLKRSDIHTDTVLLQPGWPGFYEFELDRSVANLAEMRWSDSDRRKIRYVWDRGRDPDFDIFEARENVEETGLTPKLLPRLLVPKSGEHVFFQCVGPALYKAQLTNPLCAVRDFTDPQNDGLAYNLKYTRLKDWRRYSNWLWKYVESITVKEID